jgi:SAM-dependent methyltransferase
VADFGCGYHAAFSRTMLGRAAHLTLVDISLACDLKCDTRITAIEGPLPASLHNLADRSLDVILCVLVLEHLWEPLEALQEFRRLLAPGGTCLLNVPSWRGKKFLEFSAVRRGLSPAEEMDELGLNTLAICKVE